MTSVRRSRNGNKRRNKTKGFLLSEKGDDGNGAAIPFYDFEANLEQAIALSLKEENIELAQLGRKTAGSEDTLVGEAQEKGEVIKEVEHTDDVVEEVIEEVSEELLEEPESTQEPTELMIEELDDAFEELEDAFEEANEGEIQADLTQESDSPFIASDREILQPPSLFHQEPKFYQFRQLPTFLLFFLTLFIACTITLIVFFEAQLFVLL